VFVGGIGVLVGGTGVFVGGMGVLVGGTGVLVGIGVFVAGTGVGVGVDVGGAELELFRGSGAMAEKSLALSSVSTPSKFRSQALLEGRVPSLVPSYNDAFAQPTVSTTCAELSSNCAKLFVPLSVIPILVKTSGVIPETVDLSAMR